MLKQTHRQALEFVESFIRENGYSPSWRDIQEGLGVTAPTVQSRLLNLRVKGLVDWIDGQPRTIRIIRPDARPVMVPLDLVDKVEALIASNGESV